MSDRAESLYLKISANSAPLRLLPRGLTAETQRTQRQIHAERFIASPSLRSLSRFPGAHFPAQGLLLSSLRRGLSTYHLLLHSHEQCQRMIPTYPDCSSCSLRRPAWLRRSSF